MYGNLETLDKILYKDRHQEKNAKKWLKNAKKCLKNAKKRMSSICICNFLFYNEYNYNLGVTGMKGSSSDPPYFFRRSSVLQDVSISSTV